MKKKEDNRRTFLKHVLTATTVVGAAAIVRPAKAKSASIFSRSDEILYYESESFKKYYKTLRS
jgi:hypothetical protein